MGARKGTSFLRFFLWEKKEAKKPALLFAAGRMPVL